MTTAEKNILYDLVYKYPSKHKKGLIANEIGDLKSKFPNLNEDKFNNALMGVTCLFSEEDGLIIYHIDVYHALLAAIENRELNIYEID